MIRIEGDARRKHIEHDMVMRKNQLSTGGYISGDFGMVPLKVASRVKACIIKTCLNSLK